MSLFYDMSVFFFKHDPADCFLTGNLVVLEMSKCYCSYSFHLISAKFYEALLPWRKTGCYFPWQLAIGFKKCGMWKF